MLSLVPTSQRPAVAAALAVILNQSGCWDLPLVAASLMPGSLPHHVSCLASVPSKNSSCPEAEASVCSVHSLLCPTRSSLAAEKGGARLVGRRREDGNIQQGKPGLASHWNPELDSPSSIHIHPSYYSSPISQPVKQQQI
ncbi:unnamed protein product [Natator depressus]